MVEPLLIVLTALSVIAIVLIAVLLTRKSDNVFLRLEAQLTSLEKSQERTERTLKEEIVSNREETSNSSKQLREEISNNMTKLTASNEERLERMSQTVEEKLRSLQEQIKSDAKDNRDELSKSLKLFEDRFAANVNEFNELQKQKFDVLANKLTELVQSSELKLDRMRETLESKLKLIQDDTNEKLEKMRATVDEKLHETLERRLGDSFKIVSDKLEMVHKGLGEMQTIASNFGDLRKILTNIKTRGTWGEIQLGNLLEQILTKDQYAQNVATKKGSSERVEFAIKLPGRSKEDNQEVWLPIDAKFPREDYERLIEASEQSNPVMLEEAAKQLEVRIKNSAKDIKDKYLDPPNTTDFGIMFLPIEGIYSEVLRRPGLFEILQREYRVVVAGPTTLAALLNSLQMGFRTLAIEKRSSEVWVLLGAVKNEFGKFGDILDKTHKKLQEASNTIEDAARKSRTIERRLKGVQELPSQEAVISIEEE